MKDKIIDTVNRHPANTKKYLNEWLWRECEIMVRSMIKWGRKDEDLECEDSWFREPSITDASTDYMLGKIEDAAGRAMWWDHKVQDYAASEGLFTERLFGRKFEEKASEYIRIIIREELRH